MPSEKTLQKKRALVDELRNKLENAAAGVIVDYKGINVENDTVMRKELREAGVDYFVLKNTLLRRAIAETNFAGLEDVLKGTTSIAICNDDPVLAAKIIAKYTTEYKDIIKIKAGFVDGRVIDIKEVGELANLPPREVLIAMFLGGLNAPISGLANVLNANIRGLAVALSQIAEKKSA
ncbi:MAG: 50S ribosomal protein L10 [Oscillospiraceae bacterium]|nr:50S ribosomal protein L10 [Oscillospiraceae bacterium]